MSKSGSACDCETTAEAISLTREAKKWGADAALLITPYYNKPTQEGLYAHYMAVADAVDIPQILYNVPARTGCDLAPETTGELSLHPNIVGIKEARAEEARMDALLPYRRDGFAVLSGDDPTAVRAMLAGADGVVSVASNVVPASFRRLCDLALAGDAQGAQALDAELYGLYHFLGIEPNPIPVKALLALDGIGQGLRLPLQPLSSAHAAEAQRQRDGIAKLEERCRASAA